MLIKNTVKQLMVLRTIYQVYKEKLTLSPNKIMSANSFAEKKTYFGETVKCSTKLSSRERDQI